MNPWRSFWRLLWLWLAQARPPERSRPAWTQADADQWSAFLKSATGQKLCELMRAEEAQRNLDAIMSGTPQACGFASGWRWHACWLMAMSDFAARPVLNNGDREETRPEGAADLLERLAP